jgi:hypothetical protein
MRAMDEREKPSETWMASFIKFCMIATLRRANASSVPEARRYQAPRTEIGIAALTRRAKHWQNGIIERVWFSPRGSIPARVFHFGDP